MTLQERIDVLIGAEQQCVEECVCAPEASRDCSSCRSRGRIRAMRQDLEAQKACLVVDEDGQVNALQEQVRRLEDRIAGVSQDKDRRLVDHEHRIAKIERGSK